MPPPNLITDHSREETALREIAVTSVQTRLAVWMTGIFLLSICSIAVLWLLDGKLLGHSQGKPSQPHAATTSAETNEAQTVREDHLGFVVQITALNESLKQRLKRYERSLEENSPLSRWTLPWLQSFCCRFLGQGNEKVYIGRTGWLFFRPDVDHLLGGGFLGNQSADKSWSCNPIPALIRFKEDLAARGIRLLVVPVPSKAAIAPSYLSTRFASADAPLENPSYPIFLEQLRSHGIEALDLSVPLSKMKSPSDDPCYLKTDTHWAPFGMEQAAALIASRIRVSAGAGTDDTSRFSHTTPLTMTNRGDLAVMLKLPAGTSLYPAEDTVIHPVNGPDGKPWKPTPSSGVLVLGDSFARIYSGEDLGWGTSAGLAEQLSYFLQQPVDLLAINAGGASTSRQALARSTERLNGVKTVVYEFAMRELSSGNWKVIPLPPVSAVNRRSEQPSRRISGTIAGVTHPPSPTGSPYRDVITCLHLKNVSGTSEKEILVFLYGMRNHALTEASSLDVGQEVSLEVVPWEGKERELGSIQRVEPSGEEAELEGIYWTDDYSATR